MPYLGRDPSTTVSAGPRPNLVTNGNFTVAQRGATITSPASGAYLLDMWKTWYTTAGAVTVTQDQTGVFAEWGTDYSMKIDVTTADASIASGDRFIVLTPIEAQDLQHLKWGRSDAESFTISFCFRSPKSGTHYVALWVQDGNRYIWRSFTVTSADTAEYFELTFAGDTGGTINNDTGLGMNLVFPLMAGTAFEAGSDNTWAADEKYGAATIQNLLDNTANNIFIGRVKMEVGTEATDFPFEDYGTTAIKCKRYFERWTFAANKWLCIGHAYTTTAATAPLICQVEKRAAPTCTIATATGGDFLTGGGFTAMTDISFDDLTKEGGRIFMTCSSGLGQDEAMACRVDANNPIDFSAEL